MPEPVTAAALASAAVSIVAPYLAELAKSGAGKLGEVGAAGVGKLWGRLTARLTGSGAEAAEDARKNPDDPDAQGALRLQLRKALEADPEFRAEIAALVAESGGGGSTATQTATQIGDGNVQGQASHGGTVNIGGGAKSTGPAARRTRRPPPRPRSTRRSRGATTSSCRCRAASSTSTART